MHHHKDFAGLISHGETHYMAATNYRLRWTFWRCNADLLHEVYSVTNMKCLPFLSPHHLLPAFGTNRMPWLRLDLLMSCLYACSPSAAICSLLLRFVPMQVCQARILPFRKVTAESCRRHSRPHVFPPDTLGCRNPPCMVHASSESRSAKLLRADQSS